MKKFNKKIIYALLFAFCLTASAFPAFTQKYKRIEDTVRLNKEFLELNQSLTDLGGKLAVAESELTALKDKAANAAGDAVKAAAESSNQAAKATGGSVKDAKRAKRKANKAYGDARASNTAQGRVTAQENKIKRLNNEVAKKQQRLQQLTSMQANIYSKAGISVN